jgi:muramoyltetrapeptide carboxypeptidase
MTVKRRDFGRIATAGTIALLSSAVNASTATATSRRHRIEKNMPLIKPRALKQGDAVAIITPGGFVDDALIEKSVRNLESIGLKPRLLPNIKAARGNFAGTVKQRVDDLHAAFRADDVKALWAIRGGSGCAQILPSLDYAMMRKHPKIVIGYSDITALLIALHRHSGLVTFHGPVASSTFSDYSVNHLRAVLFERAAPYVMRTAADNDAKAAEAPEYQARALRAGVCEGILTGGNLSVLAALIGTAFAPTLNDALLFIEEIGEAPYRIDRLLTQLAQSYSGAAPSGVMLGVLRKCEPAKDEPSLSLSETLNDFAAINTTPVVAGYSFGHISHQMTLPIGIRARLSSADQTLTLLEAATSA